MDRSLVHAREASWWLRAVALVGLSIVFLPLGGCDPSSAEAGGTGGAAGGAASKSPTVAVIEEDDEDEPRDPFDFDEVVEGEEHSGLENVLGAAGFAAERVAARRAELVRAAAGLTLTSIMSGSNPLVCINTKIMRLKDVVEVDGVEFEFVGVKGDAARLIAQDLNYGLTVGQGTAVVVLLDRTGPAQVEEPEPESN